MQVDLNSRNLTSVGHTQGRVHDFQWSDASSEVCASSFLGMNFMKLLLLFFFGSYIHFLEAILKSDPFVNLVFVDIFTVHTGEYLAGKGKMHVRNFFRPCPLTYIEQILIYTGNNPCNSFYIFVSVYLLLLGRSNEVRPGPAGKHSLLYV